MGPGRSVQLFSNKVLSVGEGGLLCTDDDEAAAFARSRRSHSMTSGTSDARGARSDSYDVTSLGFNYRLDEPRAALLLSRLQRLEGDIALLRQLTLRYRELLSGVDGIIVPFEDVDVASSSCHLMPVMIEQGDRRAEVIGRLRERGIQTSIHYPSIHHFTAYREWFPDVSLPTTELASRSQLTLPLYPHMTHADQDRVITALAGALAP